jgi:uroporphyrin-III C-methyltransferase/precorrin-2 dehydrogenase/sirohydrochlorin ferrochelatase
VTLVGAGPGDPDLLTVRALNRLAEADLVLYDALSSPEVRALAPEARWFFVGKRAGRASINQDTTNRLMIREAGRGRHVVRLKAGDPFVLGRGGEEALALAAAGVPCEIVPGVTSAFGAPALAGIPVTHRGLATAVAVLSAHAEEAYAPLVDSLAPASATLVVLMGLRTRAALAARLAARGWSGTTPAAIILGAASPAQSLWVGTLATLGAAAVDPAHVPSGYGVVDRPPGLIVIGNVVAVANEIDALVVTAATR